MHPHHTGAQHMCVVRKSLFDGRQVLGVAVHKMQSTRQHHEPNWLVDLPTCTGVDNPCTSLASMRNSTFASAHSAPPLMLWKGWPLWKCIQVRWIIIPTPPAPTMPYWHGRESKTHHDTLHSGAFMICVAQMCACQCACQVYCDLDYECNIHDSCKVRRSFF